MSVSVSCCLRSWSIVASLAMLVACGDGVDPEPRFVGPPDAALTFDAAAIGPPISSRDASTTLRGRCDGSATACELMSSACWGGAGCVSEMYCVGAALSCYRRTEYACARQDGCYWASAACQGSATPCSILSQVQCGDQLGCFIDSHCVGSPTACILFDHSSTCLAQPGCTWTAE